MIKLNKEALKAITGKIDVNILVFDPATETGWASLVDNNIEFGSFVLSNPKQEKIGNKWIQFENIVKDLVSKNKFDLIVYEIPVVRHAGATIHHSKLACLIEKIAAEKGCLIGKVDPKTIKKWLSGNGNASKEEMIGLINKFFQVDNNDNIADALSILLYKKYQILSGNSKI